MEDNPGDVRLVVEALRQGRLLHHLCIAASGDEAMAVLRREGRHAHCLRPDLILLDLNLPGLSGHELLHVLKSDPTFARIPVVVLTGSVAHEDIVRAYASHANCYIRKPVDLDQLLGVMRTVGNFWLSVVDLPGAGSRERLGNWRLLLVEDNPGDARLVVEMLSAPQLEIVHVERLSDALDRLRDGAFTVALADPGLPDSSGIDTIGALLRAAPLLPVVVLSGAEDENLALRAIQLGAQDYVVKGRVDADALVRVMRYAVERKLVQERLDYLATHDGVSGLPNRQVFIDELGHAIAQCQLRSHDAAVLMVSLSGLSRVNQVHGHDFGDLVIGAAVARMRNVLPSAARVACTGSAEFSVILTDTQSIMDTPHIAEELIAEIGRPGTINGQQYSLGANVGMSLFGIDAETPSTLLKCAETALYQAKSVGRNTFRFYSAKMNATVLDRLAIEHDLRDAIDREDFELHFQPLFDVMDGSLVGAEALLRWRHPSRGLLAPEHFLDVAEQSGSILEIGAWVVCEACRIAAAWPEIGGRRVQIAVNVSARQLVASGFAEVVDLALETSGLPPSALVIELTESMMQAESSRDMLQRLRARGVNIAIDDFGTGFSSLAYLRRFPVDVLKIDRTFLGAVTGDERDAAIVRTIVAMARNLALSVVAEGVETKAQLEFLRGIGCDKAQGYLLGRPVDAPAFSAWLGAGTHGLLSDGSS
ncbi:MAG TPA: EAL domain-containing protein [Dokdonella sp.]|uniref:putative bifunctional diguanylate cyclase/phosphodiesterase n=1 Tax=Dokdonella sp. TaxID=2291710 RepID=UPI0025BD2897|nr:EAL domain-containing protein [Dokdonella sp.]MBX3693105.1 EAL domain-containing protein [Dokdonella sp.]HNR91364.1 EAL domain-containing protein [Dokdonella sp.]